MSLGSDPIFSPRLQRRESELVSEAISRSRRGDMEAVHFLYVRYASEIQAGIRDLVAGEREAQNVTESMFGQLTELMGGYESREQPFAQWLIGVARAKRFRPLLGGQQRVPGG
jgi:hypothetical protein